MLVSLLLLASLLWLASLLFYAFMLLCCVQLLPAAVDIPSVPGVPTNVCVSSVVDIPVVAGVPSAFSSYAVVWVLIMLRSCCCWHPFCSWLFTLLALLCCGIPAVFSIHDAIGVSAVAWVRLWLAFLPFLAFVVFCCCFMGSCRCWHSFCPWCFHLY